MIAENEKGSGNNILAMLLVFFGVLAIGFMARSVAFLFLMVVGVALFIGSIFYLISNFQKEKERKEFDKSVEGTIAENILLCDEQIRKNEMESDEIKQNISEIKDKLNSHIPIHEAAVNDSRALIEGFENQLELRTAKLDFYYACKDKMESIQYNQEIANELKRKKEKLDKLKENHFEDLAEMERMRSDIEYDRTYLDTINLLTLRMAESTSLDSAQALHQELKSITKELRDL